MKLRPKQAFRDAINEARRVFGTDGNSCVKICRRALRWFKTCNKEIEHFRGVGVGNPMSLDIETEYNNNDFQSIVIMYANDQLEKSRKRVYAKFSGDETVNFRIAEGE